MISILNSFLSLEFLSKAMNAKKGKEKKKQQYIPKTFLSILKKSGVSFPLQQLLFRMQYS